MPKQPIKKITLFGAGLVGSLLSIFLAKRGYQVEIFERRRDMREVGAAEGRSINLALSMRGWQPLKAVGLKEQVREMVIPMEGRMMHDAEGNLTFQRYGKEGQFINSISRGGLNALLMNHAEKNGVKIRFQKRCEDVNFENTTAEVCCEVTDKKSKVESDLIIGTDGAFSAVRTEMQKTDRFNYEQFYLDHGYKELSIPATSTGDFAIAPNALHIWPRGGYMLIALPNLDRSFTCTLFFPFEGEKSFHEINTPEEVQAFFKESFPDVLELMPDLGHDYFDNPTSSLVTVKCFPWTRGNCLIIGDASHAIVPFYGQGMNSGFEDCYVLDQMIEKYADDWSKILPAYEASRKPNADAIAELAIKNFYEMRDRVADTKFLLRKKIESRINDLYPEKWIPEYSMVTFSHIPYAEAQAKGTKQKEVMDGVMKTTGIETNWESLDFQSIADSV